MKKIQNWTQFNEGKSDDIIFEMTGSPRDFMQMLPPKERTKDVFATELAKYGYKRGRLNKDCDLLVCESKEIFSNKMKKAIDDFGCDIVTYKSLINKYKMFKNNESFDQEYKYEN